MIIIYAIPWFLGESWWHVSCNTPILDQAWPIQDSQGKGRHWNIIWIDCKQQTWDIWWFPKIVVPLVIIHFSGPFKPSIVGYHHLWKPPYSDMFWYSTHQGLGHKIKNNVRNERAVGYTKVLGDLIWLWCWILTHNPLGVARWPPKEKKKHFRCNMM